MSLLPGVNRLETLLKAQNARLDAENEATKQHRKWEGDKLRKIETLAESTDKRVDDHDVQLGKIGERLSTNLRLISAAASLATVGVLVFYLLH